MVAARAAFSHPGMKGAVTENVVIEFLKKYLPRNLDVCSGILIDSKGAVSRQLDIIIFDANKTPSLFFNAGLRVVPVECAYAVIEVKMQLSSQTLNDCIENMKSVKSLDRSSYYEQGQVIAHATKLYGIEKDFWSDTLYFVFAFETKMQLSNLAIILNNFAESSAVNKRIDSIYCLDAGFICNHSGEGIDALPSNISKFVVVKDNSLLIFYACLARYMNQANIPNFNFTKYIQSIIVKLGLLN